jgi:regulator of protease activity HflC (stomatin/prohibitin superfamily)
MKTAKGKFSILGGTLIGVIVVAVILFFMFFVVVIDAGEVGVVSTFGNVSDQPLYSGLQFKNPFANIIRMPIRTVDYTMSGVTYEGKKVGDDSIEALASDGATVWLDVTVLYHLKAEDAPEVYKTLGLEYEESLIRPAIRSEIRQSVSNFKVVEIYSEKRTELADNIKTALQESLDDRGIEVEDVLLRDVTLSQQLYDSIEQKLAAQQEAQRMEFLLEKEEKEAERKVIEAKGQRDSQKIINESLTDKYLYYLYITNLENLNGTIYVPTEGGLPLFKSVD